MFNGLNNHHHIMETYALANCFILFSIAALQERRVHQQLFKVSDMFCDFFKHSSEPSLTE